MYCCYFTQCGHIILRQDLDVPTLSAAITLGHRMLAEWAAVKNLDGIEIWADAKLLYASAGQMPNFTAH